MSEYMSIYDDLFNVRDKLTSQEYININNKISNLIRKIKNYENDDLSEPDNDSDNDTNITLPPNPYANVEYVDFDLLKQNYVETAEVFESCGCRKLDLINNNYLNGCEMCSIPDCCNFKIICEHAPLIKNILPEHFDNKFTDALETNICQPNEYKKKYLINVLSILVSNFISYDNYLILIICCDYIIRYYSYFYQDKKLIKSVKNKFNQLRNSDKGKELIKKYNIKDERWNITIRAFLN